MAESRASIYSTFVLFRRGNEQTSGQRLIGATLLLTTLPSVAIVASCPHSRFSFLAPLMFPTPKRSPGPQIRSREWIMRDLI